MHTTTWPLQEAKNQLSQLVDAALIRGAQTITRHGKPVVVVLPAEEYAALKHRPKLTAIMAACPIKNLQIPRNPCPAPSFSPKFSPQKSN